ncbi:MAG TPA: glucose-6-phosphate isomerase [Thermoanaerobaculia bacterium]|nr:glucose-6-phosphate isomerase [Thermoanaerobaculia bacterium]
MGSGFEAEVDRLLEESGRRRIVERLWGRDHTLWSESPEEISNRLGWLDAPAAMRELLPALSDLARETREEEVRDLVLLGMGGSSLGAEVLWQVCGRASGHPRLHVLDSTVPAWVQRVTEATDPRRTLYLVSSKSGSTAEVAALLAHFWERAVATQGAEEAGLRFLAITDPGTSLASLAAEKCFRRLFENPPEIGGRFSVLSLFGLVPAALLGLDLRALLTGAAAMAEACGAGTPDGENPGLGLGVAMAAAVRTGRPFLGLLAGRRLASFGLWAEQLVAESLGKNGQGIVPVTEEPLPAAGTLPPGDRLFVRLRLAGESEPALDRLAADLAAARRPLLDLALASPESLGAEFFRWELATAVAGALLGVHPFDQPDVESTKRETRRLLAACRETGALPAVAVESDLEAALAAGPAPAYVALLAYTDDRPEIADAARALRSRLGARLGVPTTFGFGPRYLHSTGQLHKGGPAGGLFVQILGLGEDLPIPGEEFGFATLARAQADGDLLALRASGRQVVRIEIAGDPAEALAGLAGA